MKIIITTLFIIFFVFFKTDTQAQQTAVISTKRDVPIGIVSFGSTVVSGVLGSDNFIDGYIRKSGSNAFAFPVGDNGALRPFGASASEITGAYFGVDPNLAVTSNPMGGDFGVLPAGGPFNTSLFTTELKTITRKEYWDINGSNATKITLTWNPASDIAALVAGKGLGKLTIAGWDGSKWVRIVSTVDATSILEGTSDLTAGSITTDSPLVPETYAVYSLGALIDGSLPVTLVAFNARSVEHAAYVNWTTSSETNSSRFDIERSANGKTWRILGTVITKSDDNGTSSEVLEYGFQDASPLVGINYYRLKMVDRDETFAYSNIREVKFGISPGIAVYPNPVSDRLFLKGMDHKIIDSAKLISSNGQSIQLAESSLNEGVDVSKMPAGIYVLNLSLIDGQLKSFQIMVGR